MTATDEHRVRRATTPRGALRVGASCLVGVGAVALLVAACGPRASTGLRASTGSSPAAAATSSSGSIAVVKVATVAGYGQILTDSRGKPLYTLRGSCTGACASAWPALTVPAATTVTGAAGVTGTLKAVRRSDRTYQVEYNGSPLYTFVSDPSDQVTGQGISGFSVVTVSGSATGGSSSAGPGPTTGAGSGY